MKTVIGVFTEELYAQEAMEELQRRGFAPEDISVIMKDTRIDAGVVSEKNYGGGLIKGTTSGVATGAILGGIAGFLVGIGALTLPGIGAFLVGGPLAIALGLTGTTATTLTGAATGAVAGGLVGALMGLGLSKEQAVAYEEQIKDGAILMAVPVTQTYESDVHTILHRCNATDITSVRVPSDRFQSQAMNHFNESYEKDDKAEPVPTFEQERDPYANVGIKGGHSMTRLTRNLQSSVRMKKRLL